MLPDPMIGQRIGRYVIHRQLAEGGMGAVYLATHERLENTQKVVKILLPVYARNPMLRERFEREALAVSRLRHDHIVTIDDYGQLPDGQLFLMMPFLEGRPLDAHLAQGRRLTEHHALQLSVQICSALQYMHDRGLVHCDIKPSNIFIGQTDENAYHVTLIDLGIAKSHTDRDRVTHSGAQMGTPAYMPVEQYENAGDVTPLADLCAVAIVIWEMVAGALPWGMHSAPVLYKKQKTERPARPLMMSEAFWTILSRGLSPHPEDRQQSMRELANALANEVRAIPPHVPSGAEILAKYAKSLLQHAPMDAETVRNAPNQNPERVAPILWPPRETHVSPAPPGEIASNTVNTSPASPSAARHAAAAIEAAPAPTQSLPTTLSPASGITVAPAVRRARHTSIVLASVSCSLVGVAVYALVGREAHDGPRSVHRPSSEISRNGPAAIPPPDAAPWDARGEEPAATEAKRDEAKQLTDPATAAMKRHAPNETTAPSRPRTHVPDVVPEVPGQGSNDQKFDPNAVGGQAE